MNWKEKLYALEKAKKWDQAISFMQEVIEHNPHDMHAYIFMNYLLMNLVTEEYMRDKSKDTFYKYLLKKYFDESYAKFSDNAEYLYLTGRTAVMGEWFFGIDERNRDEMLSKARELEPDNLVYKETYYAELEKADPKDSRLKLYKEMLLTKDNPVEKWLKKRGALGEYLLKMVRPAE